MATLSELEEDLAAYRAARNKALTAQSYRMGEMELKRPELKNLETKINELEIRIARLKGPTHSYPVFGGRS